MVVRQHDRSETLVSVSLGDLFMNVPANVSKYCRSLIFIIIFLLFGCTPNKLEPIGHLDIELGTAFNTTIADGYVYIANGFDGLVIVDVTDPERPREVSRYETEGRLNDIAILDDVLYLSIAGKGIISLDVTEKGSPEFISEYSIGENTVWSWISIKDNLLLDWRRSRSMLNNGRLTLFEARDTQLIQLESLEFFIGEPLSVQDEYLFTYSPIGSHNNLQIVDLNQLKITSRHSTGQNEIVSLTFSEDKSMALSVNVYGDGSMIYDTTNLTSPIPYDSRIEIGGPAGYVHNNLAYFINPLGGLFVYDVEDPNQPNLIATYKPQRDERWHLFDLKGDGSYIYLFDKRRGVLIFDIADVVSQK
ncbi:MAG: hypothetical protein AAF490_09965 [Chloroflexota bacterium]